MKVMHEYINEKKEKRKRRFKGSRKEEKDCKEEGSK